MISTNKDITSFQIFSITLCSLMFGLNLYPSTIDHNISDQWLIAQVISVFAVLIIVLFLNSIFESVDCDSFGEAIRALIGNIPSRIIGIFLSLYFLLHALRIIVLESGNIQLFLFDKTPFWVIGVVIVVVAFIISLPDVRSFAKLCELLAVPALFIVITSLIMFVSSSDLEELKPMFQFNSQGILSQLRNNTSCISCIEITAFFLCRAKNKKSRKAALLCGYLFCAAALILLTVSIVGTFTLNAGADLIYPVTELARTIQLKYLRVIERFDIVIIFIKIISACLFASAACFCSAESLSMVFSPRKFRYSIPIYVSVLCILFFAFEESFIDFISKILIYSEIVVLFVFIPILYIISRIRNKGDRSCVQDGC